MRTYMKRNAMWAAMHPSMGMGQGPWTFGDPEVEQVLLAAAKLHDRLQPYFYSQAVRFFLDGYPWSMTPLPIAFPDDPQVYGRENASVRGFEWMIGDALLAAPLYGNDYETASTRDIYLPSGVWMEYDSGRRHQGPLLLKNYTVPVGQSPLFVGGTGIVVEKRDKALVARIYPIAAQTESRFIHPDGQSVSVIRVNVADWKQPTVRVSSGRPCSGTWQRHAFEFIIQPGEDYEIR
jgi:alpha-glucosidase (family GH31 glycosyl hydrolase)